MDEVQLNEATAAHRRMYFYLVDATDGLTPETGEAAGQPQISTNGGAYTNTGIGTLTHMGNGQYYADLTQAAVNGTVGDVIMGRFKSANTAEAPSLNAFRVVTHDPHDNIAASVTAQVSADVTAISGDATAADNLEATFDGTGYAHATGFEDGAVWFDSARGSAGTTFPIGTAESPASNAANAFTIMSNNNLFRLKLADTLTLAGALTGYNEIIGIGRASALLSLGGQNIGTILLVKNCFLTGTQGTGTAVVENSLLSDVVSFLGICKDVEISDTLDFKASANDSRFDGVTFVLSSGVATDLDLTGITSNIYMERCSGEVQVSNLTTGQTLILSFSGAGKVTVNASCTGGTIIVRGAPELVDNSNGSTVTDERSCIPTAGTVLTVNCKVSGSNVQGVDVDLYESDGTTFKTRATTDGNGDALFYVTDTLTYTVAPSKNGYTFASDTVTMSGNTTKNMTGTATSESADATDYEVLALRRQKMLYNDANTDNPLLAQLVIDGVKKTPTSGTVSIFDTDGTELVTDAACTVDGTLLKYSVDTTSTGSYPVEEGYRAEYEIVFNTVTYKRTVMFDVTKFLLHLGLVRDRMLEIDDEVKAMQFADQDDLSPILVGVRDEINVLLESFATESDEVVENMILDQGKLSAVVRYKALAYLFRAKGNTEKFESYSGTFDLLWPIYKRSIRWDADQDGSENAERGTVVDETWKL